MTRSSIVSRFTKTCLSKLEKIQISLAALSLEMNLGCSSMTSKPKDRASSGQPQIHHNPRKCACQSQKSKLCQSLSLTKRIWCIISLCLKTKQKTSISISMLSTASMTRFTAADQLFGKTNPRCSTMKIYLHTLCSACGSC